MRICTAAMTVAATILGLATPGAAQRVVRPGPGVRPPVPEVPGTRWDMRGGHWDVGGSAPGGWAAYRRPYRGWALPRYWTQPGFEVGDASRFGLPSPPDGYRWTRYYDDAVLVDPRGSVYDLVDGIDWYGDLPPPDPDPAGFDPPPVMNRPAPPPPGRPYERRVSPDGATTVTTTATAGYAADGWYHPGGTTTTVVVQSAPTVTTTTTDIYEDAVTYTPVRRAVRRPAARTKRRPRCAC